MLGPRSRIGPQLGENTVEVKSLEGPGSLGNNLVKCELKKAEQNDELGKMKCKRNFVRKLNGSQRITRDNTYTMLTLYII